MEIEYIFGVKKINGRGLEEILENIPSKPKEIAIAVHEIFNKVNSKAGLIHILKSYREELTPVAIIICIKAILNIPLSEANEILEGVLID